MLGKILLGLGVIFCAYFVFAFIMGSKFIFKYQHQPNKRAKFVNIHWIIIGLFLVELIMLCCFSTLLEDSVLIDCGIVGYIGCILLFLSNRRMLKAIKQIKKDEKALENTMVML